MEATAQEVFESWKESIVKGEEFFEEINKLKTDSEIEEKFGKQLNFNVAGARAVGGLGTNKLNVYTVRRLALGVHSYFNSAEKDGAVVIAYDTRKESQKLAKSAAEIFATYNRKVYIFRAPQPAAVLSYTIRYIKADIGIMLSAGGSLKQLNGFKVYAGHGGPVNAETAGGIAAQIETIQNIFDIERRIFDDLILRSKVFYVPELIYQSFLEEVLGLRLETGTSSLKVVYTPLNGAGSVPVREILRMSGYKKTEIVGKQEQPDGSFATCNPPSPDNSAAMAPALEQAKSAGADIVLATDPDAGALAVFAGTKDGFIRLSNEDLGTLLLNYIIVRNKEKNNLFKSPVVIKGKAEGGLATAICKEHKIELVETAEGFRFIAEYIESLVKQGRIKDFVFGFDGNGGFLYGTQGREADSVAAAMLVCDMASYYKRKHKDLSAVLDGLKSKYYKS